MRVEIAPLAYKQVQWFGLTLFIESHHKYVAADKAGYVRSFEDKPLLLNEAGKYSPSGSDVCKVDLEHTHWFDTLAEYSPSAQVESYNNPTIKIITARSENENYIVTKDDCLDKMVPSDLRQLVCERDHALKEHDALVAQVEVLRKENRYKSEYLDEATGRVEANIIEKHEAFDKCKELAATVEALHAALNNLHDVAARCDGWESFPQKSLDIACDALKATPQQHLAEVRAQAVIGAIDAHKNNVMTFGFDSAIRVTDLIIYANSIRQGEVT